MGQVGGGVVGGHVTTGGQVGQVGQVGGGVVDGHVTTGEVSVHVVGMVETFSCHNNYMLAFILAIQKRGI